MQGFLNINKPAGPSSHDVVYAIRRWVGKAVKVGHAGTLDPFAQGVLVVCLGGACRLASMMMEQAKQYRTVIMLGARSDTDDCTGSIEASPAAVAPAVKEIQRVLANLVGEVQQVPPAHSAILVAGRRAYKIARNGGQLDLPARPVRIDSIRLLEYSYPRLAIEVDCGSGTYIRALARDIGAALGVGGYCQELIRIRSGGFRVEQAVGPDQIDLSRDLVSPLAALGDTPRAQLTAEQTLQVLLGRRLPLKASPGELAVLDDRGELLALGTISDDGSFFQPGKVLVNTHAKYGGRGPHRATGE